MKIKLLNHTVDPEIAVVNAARTCYQSKSDSKPGKLGPRDAKLLKRLITMEHMSVLEHITFTFRISGVSRALTHQLVRHRIASYAQQSQRYVREKGFHYVVPPSIAKSKHRKRYMKLMGEIDRFYNDMIDDTIPGEDSRYILPNACCTEIVVTMNARSWLHFLKLREAVHAQWEIRALAASIRRALVRVAPLIFSAG